MKFFNARTPHLFARITPEGIEVGLEGALSRKLTYGGMPSPPPFSSIAADVGLALAFIVGDRGVTDVATKLLECSARESLMVMNPDLLVTTVANLTRADRRKPVVTLVARAHEIESSESRDSALAGFVSSSLDAKPNFIKRVASVVEDSAAAYSAPGMAYYNAGSLLRHANPQSAVRLYKQAASAEPAYLTRPYWWRELGDIYLHLGDREEAESQLRHAVKLGDDRATIALADLLTYEGQYAAAATLLDTVDLSSRLDFAPARLQRLALEHVADHWGITEQVREQKDWAEPTDGREHLQVLDDAIRADALNGWAHWARCATLAKAGEQAFDSHLAAAAFERDVPAMWDELIRNAITIDRWDIAFDALWTARARCGDEFVEMLHTDTFFDPDTRRSLMSLFESLPPSEPDIEFRRIGEDGRTIEFSPRMSAEADASNDHLDAGEKQD